jgi:hypothetical protein
LRSASSCTSETSALRSWTLKVTPFFTTACRGSGTRIAAGAHPWQMPNHVAEQRPAEAPARSAQISPAGASHSAFSAHAFALVSESMP